MTTLVIVESPAKAKTIAGYLGKGYEVTASYGHVRDLPERADEIPADMKKVKWAKLGVNVEGSFEPLYVVPDDKKRNVDALKRMAKDADALLLATDEDREGESISWHILQLLKPKKSQTVKRIVFHEITPEAIKEALANPRDIDESLVRAQETRRILDRLYGYTISPVLWKKVAPKLSAGRVQSVAVRLLVDREKERAAFKTATYWDLVATVADASAEGAPKLEVRLQSVGGKRLATGKSFDTTTGAFTDAGAVLLGEAEAKALAEEAVNARGWKVAKLETRPDTEKPPVPFMTSTLQQEANRRLRYSSKRTMQIAQQLYEGIDLGGERVGLITYMRTDSLTLSERALSEARTVIADLYGKEYLPPEPVRYRTKSKNAQEAHEAIRPTDLSRRPEDLRRYLDPDQLRLYELIWKRTLACQMVPARVSRTQVAVDVVAKHAGKDETLRFTASGKQIVFPGFLRAYVEGSDDPDAELENRETILPPLAEGQALGAEKVLPQGHSTKPPARLTEASLVKRLEEAGVGRPSTYASIISTIQDRGYCFKHGNELVPTFVAFAVVELLDKHFGELIDLSFTARMEDELDEIAGGKRDHVEQLSHFYRGDAGHPGLTVRVEEETPKINFPAIKVGEDPETKEPIVVRVGRYGTFIQRGEGGKGNTASIPEDTLPADLTMETAVELLRRKGEGPKVVGTDPKTGRSVTLRTGRFGSYLEVEQTEEEAKAEEKPRRASVPEDVDPYSIGQADIDVLFSYPRNLGKHPDNGEDVIVNLGRYGAYIRAGGDTRNAGTWREGAQMSLESAVALLRAPKIARGRGKAAVARVPVKEWTQGVEKAIRVFEGKYGLYATDGETNATLPRGVDLSALTVEEALAAIRERAAKGPSKKGRGRGRFGKGGASKKSAAPQADAGDGAAPKKPAKRAAKAKPKAPKVPKAT
jgi:DNA topoisomerase-1